VAGGVGAVQRHRDQRRRAELGTDRRCHCQPAEHAGAARDERGGEQCAAAQAGVADRAAGGQRHRPVPVAGEGGDKRVGRRWCHLGGDPDERGADHEPGRVGKQGQCRGAARADEQ
jgi:hypothetical protein